MKRNKIVLPLVLALTALVAATGCHKGLSGQTVIPGQRHEVAQTGPEPTLPSGPPVSPTEPVTTTPNPPPPPPEVNPTQPPKPIPTSDKWDPAEMAQDREKLAAYIVHFKFDSAVVQDKEQANITSVAQALSGDPNAKLLIEGHCDERGTEEYNRSLGERRALALREALAKIGVDPMRIRTVSYGKDKPIDPGHNETAWAKNRRGEFIYCTPKAPVQ